MAFLDDYYCTSEAWSVQEVRASACWRRPIPGCTRRPTRARTATTRTAATSARSARLVLKSTTAHLFHVGDARIYRLQGGGTLEQLTQDHRVRVSQEQSYLSRALGFNAQLEIDYHALRGRARRRVRACHRRRLRARRRARSSLERDRASTRGDLDAAARAIVAEAYRARQRRQPDRADRARRRPAGARGAASCTSSSPSCRSPPLLGAAR